MKKILSFFVKNDKTLIPSSKESEEFVEKKLNKNVKEIFLTEYKYRILKHHKKFFAIMQKFLDNIDTEMSIEDLLIYLKLKTGYYKEITFKNQKVIIPSSISFLEMNQVEFEEFYQKSVRILADILGISVRKLEEESIIYE